MYLSNIQACTYRKKAKIFQLVEKTAKVWLLWQLVAVDNYGKLWWPGVVTTAKVTLVTEDSVQAKYGYSRRIISSQD